MIKVTVYTDNSDRYRGFICRGHSGYADPGMDIVCSSVSAVVIGTCNSLEKLTDDSIDLRSDEEDGLIDVRFPEGLSHDGELLVRSMIITLQDIADQYSDFIKFNIEEV